ncbi:MAG: hypothetical protein ACE366_03175 [Bradymonadia bacterium]
MAALAGGYVWLDGARTSQEDASSAQSLAEFNGHVADMEDQETLAIGGAVVGGVALITAVTLLVTSTTATDAQVSSAPQGSLGTGLSWRF